MNKLVKYMAMVFAVVLSVAIIGGGTAALVVIVQGIARETDMFGSVDEGGVFYYDENGNAVVFGITIGGTEETVSFTKTFGQEEIKSVSIDTGSGEVIVKIGDTFEVAAENVPKSYRAEVKNGVLCVYKERRPFSLFSFQFFAPKQKITVTVPEGFVAEEFSLECGSGRLEVSGIATDKLILDTGSGSVVLKAVTANHTDIDIGSGKMEVSDAELGAARVDSGSGTLAFSRVSTKNLFVESGSGRVNYEGIMTGNCIFDTGSGSVSLVLNASEQDYNITADMGSGNFYLNGKNMKHVDVRHEQAEHMISFDCGSGRVSVEFTKE